MIASLFTQVDIASLVFFRVSCGVVFTWWALDYLLRGRMQVLYMDPQFHFTYYGFDWVQPWPGLGMSLHFMVLAFTGLLIAVGRFYRVATWIFALGLTYVFLLDRTNYQNHYYLLVLISWLFVLLPLGCSFSLDVLDQRVERLDTIPAWMVGLTRFHIGLPYVFGGIAKFESDWFAGAPLRQTLQAHDWWPVIGRWFHAEPVVQVFIWGGLVFDLLIVPLLLWKRTRLPAYLLAVLFHLFNSQLFSIHIFPWFMMLATTIFFAPNWPRRWFRRNGETTGEHATSEFAAPPLAWRLLPRNQQMGVILLTIYCGFHCMWPLRHHLYPGPASWTEQGHFFSWRMMLRGKTVAIRYYLTNPETRLTQIPDLRPLLSPVQVGVFARDPEMILHLAHYVAQRYREEFGTDIEVRALVLTSLNGRKPQLQIDPNVDLARQPRGFHHRPWILPLTEPLPAEPWNLPIAEWEHAIDTPELTFLTTKSNSSDTQ